MHASARLVLSLAFGLPGCLSAAENMPLLRVDPALLGPAAARPAPARPAAAAAAPEGAAPAAAASATAESARSAPAAPAPAPREAAPAPRPAPAQKAAAPREPAASAQRVPAEPARAAAARPSAAEPPQVEEKPALPPLYSAHAEAGLVPAPVLSSRQDGGKGPFPTFIAASRIDGRNDNEVTAQGEAELRRDDTTLAADRLTYWKVEDELEAQGNVRYARAGDVMSGPKLRLNMTERTGYFEEPVYAFARPARTVRQPYTLTQGGGLIGGKTRSLLPKDKAQKPAMTTAGGEAADGRENTTTASGRADRLEFRGENRMRLTNATYTTCTAEDPDWYAKVAELDLDYDGEVGEGRDARVVFKDTTLFYTPWLGFSLNNKRKSGLLAPTFGTSSKSGIELSVPYYWDIAPNMDATITPRLMSKRGLQINAEYRYLNYAYQGMTRAEWLPNDRIEDRRRYGYSIQHRHNFGQGFSGVLNLNGVSDDTYLTDLHTRIASSSQGNLLRQGLLTYNGGWWSATGNVQRYQTLQDPSLPPAVKPYERVPQFALTASRPEFVGGTTFAFYGEFVDFDHPVLDTGRRLTFYPQLSLPLQTAAWHLTPKIGLHSTRYDLDRRTSVGPDNIVRNLPVLSVDAGVAFERDLSWFGQSYAQTLEPRLFYLLVPQRTQDNIPVFDSGQTDFNFATIFSDNTYTGVDRIADANQLTAALTSRLIDQKTGEEYLRGMIGQRYYFAKQHVTLPGEPARPGGASDFLAALSGRVLPRTYADAAWQYDPRDGETERFVLGGRWQPEIAKVLNASYRYTRDHSAITGGTAGIRQVDFSGQWPLGRGWYGVGRFNYSLRDRKNIETIAGLEYNGGCWVGRAVVQRYATASGDTNTAFFVQLELNDFSSIGSNPLQMLARRIPGYGRINQSISDPVFGYD